jgi:hypothetical protein
VSVAAYLPGGEKQLGVEQRVRNLEPGQGKNKDLREDKHLS